MYNKMLKTRLFPNKVKVRLFVKGIITDYPFVVCLEFNLPIRGFIFNTLLSVIPSVSTP